MKENLDYPETGSKCYDDAMCDSYGRLYDWAMANTVCPYPWRLPTNVDWDNLYHYIDGTSGTESPYYSTTAGLYLKSRYGWSGNGNGVDTYGFTALPGGFGIGYPGGAIYLDESICGYWWSANQYNAERAYGRYMCRDNNKADFGTFDKTRLLSVRCVRNL